MGSNIESCISSCRTCAACDAYAALGDSASDHAPTDMGTDAGTNAGASAVGRARPPKRRRGRGGHGLLPPVVAKANCAEGVKRQRTKRAKARFKRAQAGAKVAVRLRDADGVFFGTDTFDSSNLGEMTRERHDLGNEHGIDFGGLRKKQADAMQSEDGSLDFDKLLAIAAEANKPPEPEPEPEPAPPADPAHVVKEHKNKHQRPKNET